MLLKVQSVTNDVKVEEFIQLRHKEVYLDNKKKYLKIFRRESIESIRLEQKVIWLPLKGSESQKYFVVGECTCIWLYENNQIIFEKVRIVNFYWKSQKLK